MFASSQPSRRFCHRPGSILIPDQLTSQLGPPDPLRIRSILRLSISVRSLDQILNRLDHNLPLRLTPSIDTLPNLRPLTNLILAHYNLHSPTQLVEYVQESRTKSARGRFRQTSRNIFSISFSRPFSLSSSYENGSRN